MSVLDTALCSSSGESDSEDESESELEEDVDEDEDEETEEVLGALVAGFGFAEVVSFRFSFALFLEAPELDEDGSESEDDELESESSELDDEEEDVSGFFGLERPFLGFLSRASP